MVDEHDRGLLVVLGVSAQHSLTGAIINGGVLVLALFLPGLPQRFDELHVDTERVPRALFLIGLPLGVFAFVTL